jgi:Domain of unknown function (DUF397)
MDSAWRKSTFSDANGGGCIEVATNGVVLVRDTTDREGGTLNFSAEAWTEFVATIR